MPKVRAPPVRLEGRIMRDIPGGSVLQSSKPTQVEVSKVDLAAVLRGFSLSGFSLSDGGNRVACKHVIEALRHLLRQGVRKF
eukprot:CAMPEP_0180657150 /NCGR_PEP_ID=MMETSP1037_2-20121125/56258_1 /TAXON_ID=632150 /ORGANISM="Azadinium spinosum, Strain 3D9" /LENGTH=81 /DNA_ID=CAMNT_0022683833 /DNA_START=155 /DNA_END=397 /DNA_ORIENTATION=+